MFFDNRKEKRSRRTKVDGYLMFKSKMLHAKFNILMKNIQQKEIRFLFSHQINFKFNRN